MKARAFYPKQVMKRLAGRDTSTLDVGEVVALAFFFRRGRRYGMCIAILNEASPELLLSAKSATEVEAMKWAAKSRIHLLAA